MTGAHRANRLRLALIMLMLMILALGSFWILEILHRDREEIYNELPKGEPDYSVENFSLVRMAKNGHARYTISGTKLAHYPDHDTFEIERPVLYSMTSKQAPMTMRAEQAIVEHTVNKVHMRHHVQMDRAASPTGERFHLVSDYLLVLPDEDIVRTDKRVDITVGSSHLSGVGMIANNATREFRLLHQARGTFAPPAP